MYILNILNNRDPKPEHRGSDAKDVNTQLYIENGELKKEVQDLRLKMYVYVLYLSAYMIFNDYCIAISISYWYETSISYKNTMK